MQPQKYKLLLPGLILVATALVAAGCGGFRSGGGLSPSTTGNLSGAKYVGSATCRSCHAETHNDWQSTKHSQAFVDLKASGQQNNKNCLGCHTVGYNKTTGYVSEAATPNLEGVQCESCHGPGSLHRGNKAMIVRSTAAEVCTGCHQGTHNPFMEEWAPSKHAAALATLKSNSHASSACLKCHSADYRLAKPGEQPTLATAKDTITCVVCHSPHSTSVNAQQLRREPNELCGECHTSEGATPATTTSPHHPNNEMIQGISGGGSSKTGPHTNIQDRCVRCHMYQQDYVSDASPAQRGHGFKVNLKACAPCHDEATAASHKDGLQTEIAGKLTALKARLDAVTDATKKGTTAYKEALFNYNFIVADASGGVHNPSYARRLIDYANTQLNTL